MQAAAKKQPYFFRFPISQNSAEQFAILLALCLRRRLVTSRTLCDANALLQILLFHDAELQEALVSDAMRRYGESGQWANKKTLWYLQRDHGYAKPENSR